MMGEVYVMVKLEEKELEFEGSYRVRLYGTKEKDDELVYLLKVGSVGAMKKWLLIKTN